MIALTDNAVSAVKKAIAKSGKDGAGFRIMVETGGCASAVPSLGPARPSRARTRPAADATATASP